MIADEPATPDPASDPLVQATARVRQLQDDLRVLIRHVAGRVDKDVLPMRLTPAPATGSGQQFVTFGPSNTDFHASLLVLPPESIARDGQLLEQLYAGIDALTRLAAPADIASIRLTRALVCPGEESEMPKHVRSGARRLLRWAWASSLFGLLVFFAAVALLVHVDRGRRAIQQHERVRTDYQAITNELAPASADPEQACHGANRQAGGQNGFAAQLPERCMRFQDALLSISIVDRELQEWNTISERLSYVSPVTWLTPAPARVAGLSAEQWQSAELRTSIMMTALTGFVLPMLLGLLGACVYVYRELDRRIGTSTLNGREGMHGMLRMLLGAILGGLLGAIWTSRQPIQVDGVALSLGAVAFFVGFSVEAVFRVVDAMVRAVTDRIAKPPG